MIVDGPRTAEVIRRHPDVAAAFSMLGSGTIAMVGIGCWAPGLSNIYDALDVEDRESVSAWGVRAEVSRDFWTRAESLAKLPWTRG